MKKIYAFPLILLLVGNCFLLPNSKKESDLGALAVLVGAALGGASSDNPNDPEAPPTSPPTGSLTPTVTDAQTLYQGQALTPPISFTTGGGGAITICTSEPPLPPGLVLSITSGTVCELSGTPSGLTSGETYTVTAGNDLGSVTGTVEFEVILPPPPTGLLSASVAGKQTFYRGQALTPISFTTGGGGAITTCTSNLALPAGLSLSVISGIVCELSGTPTVLESNNTYTITVGNVSGSITGTVEFEVIDIAPSGSLTASVTGEQTFYQGQALASAISFTTGGGGAITTCTSSPLLPAGLSLSFISGTVCELSGTPTVLVSSNSYTITAGNEAGSVTGAVEFKVLVLPLPPSAPMLYSVTAGGAKAFLQWMPPANADSYTVFYGTSPGITTSSTSLVGITNFYTEINGLTQGQLYYFRVEAKNAGGSSGLSQEHSALTGSVPYGTSASGTHVDLTIGTTAGNSSGGSPSALLDPINGKLLVVTQNGANNNKLSLFRCSLDGSSCSHTDISASQGTNSGLSPSALLDPISGKLLVVTRNGANDYKPSLFRCNLDGSSCSHTDISAGQGTNSGVSHSAEIDPISGKLLVVTENGANNRKPSLFRCNLDGSSCSHTDLSAGQGNNSGQIPSAVIDPINSKLLVVTQNGANNSKPSLFRCNLDGSSCSHTDISAGQGNNSGFAPSAVIDPIHNKLLVASQDWTIGGALSLFRCNLDGSGCTNTDISVGQGASSAQNPIALIDLSNNKILVVAEFYWNDDKPSLYRCNLDGSSCSHTDISVGQGANSGQSLTTILDPIHGKLLVVTSNGANDNKLSLFSW